MAQERDAKLVQYLNEAYSKEQELVTALEAHISLTSRDAYKKRLKDHLRETKAQAKGLERRIKQLGGKAEKVDLPGPDALSEAAGKAQAAAQKAMAAAKGPLHLVRGTGGAEKMLKNAKTEFWNEAEEIANYHAIEALADAVGDRDTAKLAREYRRQEERMAKFLEKTIASLTKEVAREEIPAAQRNGGTRKRATSSRSRSTASRTKSTASRVKSTASRAKPKASRAKPKSGGTRTRAASARTKSTSSRAKSTASKARSTSSRAKPKSGGSRSRAASSGRRS